MNEVHFEEVLDGTLLSASEQVFRREEDVGAGLEPELELSLRTQNQFLGASVILMLWSFYSFRTANGQLLGPWSWLIYITRSFSKPYTLT